MRKLSLPVESTPDATISRRNFVTAATAVAGVVACPQVSSAVAEVVLSTPSTEKTTEKTADGTRPDAAAVVFLNALSKEQRAIAQLPYDDLLRVQWNFVPMTNRKGLPLRDMDAGQKDLAMNLLKSLVTDAGFVRSELIMQYEGVLREQEGPKSAARRDPGKYHFVVYGNPSNESLWAISIEGHHLSLNFVFDKGHIVDSTPQFFGANPATFQSNMQNRFEKGFQLLRDEEGLGWDLLNSLSKEHQSIAVLAAKAPSEIDSPGSPQAAPTSLQGLPASAMNDAQKTILLELLGSYCVCVPPAVMGERMKLIKEAGLEKVHFSWSGAVKPGVGHYYKVQGPTFLVEFINVQADAIGNIANHIHCVWRDLQGDFNLPATS